jgi:hypothetical protein
MKRTLIGTAIGLLVTTSAAAQQTPSSRAADTRWEPWLGCWQLLDESLRSQQDVSADEVAARARRRSQRIDRGTRVCVAPAAQGVTLTTLVGNERALEETIVADGSSQPVSDAECRGTKRSEWSTQASRLYSAAEISCGDQAPRTISSLSMMMPGPTWVDVQMIDIAGRKNIRIRRFERAAAAPPQQTRSSLLAPSAGESSWTVEDVKEASAKLAPEAVQAALVELRAGFDLTGKQLLDMDKAGVPDSIVDLMVALSYPKRFVIERPVSSGAGGSGYGFGMFDGYDAMWPFYLDSMYWSSYYSPFAYRYWGSYDPYYFPGSGYVVIDPSPAPVASGEGRVVDGRGYTRVSTRQPDPVRVNNGGGTSGTMGTGGSGNGGSSNTGSSGVSSGGYSSGGADSGGRTAVPRPPGD